MVVSNEVLLIRSTKVGFAYFHYLFSKGYVFGLVQLSYQLGKLVLVPR